MLINLDDPSCLELIETDAEQRRDETTHTIERAVWSGLANAALLVRWMLKQQQKETENAEETHCANGGHSGPVQEHG